MFAENRNINTWPFMCTVFTFSAHTHTQEKVVAQYNIKQIAFVWLPSMLGLRRNWTCAIETWTDFTWNILSLSFIIIVSWLSVCAFARQNSIYWLACQPRVAAGAFLLWCAHLYSVIFMELSFNCSTFPISCRVQFIAKNALKKFACNFFLSLFVFFFHAFVSFLSSI